MNQTKEIILTEEQNEAVEEAVNVLDGDGLTLTIGGLAGTGKTTIVKSILESLRGKKFIGVAAFTGKAVSVLRSKGVPRAQTLHSLMYTAEEDEDGVIRFVKRAVLDVDGVIVDEASMINMSLYNDLLSYGKPVVFVGDHGQLEPIGDNPRVMDNPDIKLEEIHRQAEDSLILRFAHVVRQGKRVDWATVPDGDLQSASLAQAVSTCHKYDAIICGFNRTRNAMNRNVRRNLGFSGEPKPGEQLICLKNNRRRGVFNGMMFKVDDVRGERTINAGGKLLRCLEVDAITDDGTKMRSVPVYMVKEEDNISDLQRSISGRFEPIVADFGYALTCHKAQGSEHEKVLVLEEIWRGKWDERRWRYTAATRASKKLTWVVK